MKNSSHGKLREIRFQNCGKEGAWHCSPSIDGSVHSVSKLDALKGVLRVVEVQFDL